MGAFLFFEKYELSTNSVSNSDNPHYDPYIYENIPLIRIPLRGNQNQSWPPEKEKSTSFAKVSNYMTALLGLIISGRHYLLYDNIAPEIITFNI